MATEWVYRVHIIVRAGSMSAANERAREIGFGGGEGDDDDVFGTVRLSALGRGEPTDLGCSTLMTAPMFEDLQSTAAQPAFAGLHYYCCDARLGNLIDTNSPSREDQIDEDWRWENSLEDMALLRLEAEPPQR